MPVISVPQEAEGRRGQKAQGVRPRLKVKNLRKGGRGGALVCSSVVVCVHVLSVRSSNLQDNKKPKAKQNKTNKKNQTKRSPRPKGKHQTKQ